MLLMKLVMANHLFTSLSKTIHNRKLGSKMLSLKGLKKLFLALVVFFEKERRFFAIFYVR